MPFPLGRPVLAMLAIGVVTGAWLCFRESPPRRNLELWTFASTHADVYAAIHPQIARDLGEEFAVRLIPSNAMNLRLVSLFMAHRIGDDLPDVVEIRQDALGRYLGTPADQIAFLPLNDFLATTGEKNNPTKRAADHWIDRVVRPRFAPYTKEGLIFGLPHDIHPTTLTYRADLFAQAGVDLESPTPGKTYVTWPDFQARCLRFQGYWRSIGVRDRYALDLFSANADILAALLLQRGVNLIETDGRVRLTDPIVRQTLLFYASLVAGPGRLSADSVSAGRDVWRHDLDAGVVCGIITPDWRLADLRNSGAKLDGRLRMTRLPRFADADAPTTTWGGTMIAIPRGAKDPVRAWKLIEATYLTESAMVAQSRELGILPAVSDFWSSPAVRFADPLFGGQIVNDLYISLAPSIPLQHLAADTPYATASLGYVLSQVVGLISSGAESSVIEREATGWLAARQLDVERQIEHAKLSRRD